MPIGELGTRKVVVARRDTSAEEAAALMRKHHVGDLVVVDDHNGLRVPVGIVTDRDLVIGVMAVKLDPQVFTVGDLIHQEVVTAKASQGVFETLRQMRMKGVRRMPIVDDEEGNLVAIVSADDIVQLLAEEMGELSKLITREQRREKLTRT